MNNVQQKNSGPKVLPYMVVLVMTDWMDAGNVIF